MLLIELHVTAFGGLRDLRLAFGPGLNLLYGGNERGKSTVMACLRAMLYGFGGRARGIRDNDRRRYTPWDGGRMAAALVFGHDGTRYRLERTFADRKTGDTLLLMEDATGRAIALPTGVEPGDALLGVAEAEFIQTVFVGQLSAPVHDPDDTVLAKLANLASTGEENVSFGEIDDRLRRAQVRLRAERGSGGLLGQWRAEQRTLEERLELAVRQETEQAERMDRLQALESDIREAERACGSLRAGLPRLEAAEAAVESARARLADTERAEQALLGEMALWEKEWEQEVRLRDEADAEASARRARLESERGTWREVRARAEPEADLDAAPSPRGMLLLLPLACALVLAAVGLLAGLLVRPAYAWISAGAAIPLAYLLATAANRRSRAAVHTAALETARRRLEEADRLLGPLDREIDRVDADSAAGQVRRQARLLELERKREAIEARIRAQAGDAPSAREALDAAEEDLRRETDGHTADELRSRERAAIARQSALREDHARLEAAIRHSPRDPLGVDALGALLSQTERKLREGEELHESLTLARTVYREAFESLQADFGPRLNARAASILSGLTGGRYTGLKADRRFDIRVSDPTESAYRSWEYLSGGTVDQVYLALRMAVAETIAPPGGLPLLLDDVFVQFDDERAYAGLLALRDRPGQTLLFSCHRRMADFTDAPEFNGFIRRLDL